MGGIVDVHARSGSGRPLESRSPGELLREMDDAGIESAWIAPPDRLCAVGNREGNDFLIGVVHGHPDRFLGCAVANPWYGADAARELRRAFDAGLRALFLHPPVQGFQLSDPLVDPLVEAARQAGAPVYAHTGTPVCAEPFQLSALARRHPEARFIMGHMGYADFWYDAANAAAMTENIWVETSFIDETVIVDAVARLGPRRVVFGSATPLSEMRVELEKIRGLTAAGVPPDTVERILCCNARDLLT